MTPDRRDLARLAPVADLQRRRALADLAAHLRQAQALRDACRALDARLAEADRLAAADVTLISAAQRFRTWAARERSGINLALAALLSREDALRATAALAQGRCDALAKLAEQSRLAHRRRDQRRQNEAAIPHQPDPEPADGFSADP